MAKHIYEGERGRSGRRSYEDYEAGRGWPERGREQRGAMARSSDEGRSRSWEEESERRRANEGRYGMSSYDRENDRYDSRSAFGRERNAYSSEAERGRGYEGNYENQGYGQGYGQGYNQRYSAGTGWGNRGYESERYGSSGTRGSESSGFGDYGRNYEGQSYGSYGVQGYGGSEGMSSGYSSEMYGNESYGNRGTEQSWGTGYRGNEWGQGRNSYGSQSEWQQRGQHTGRGPQGYKRSDQRIEEDVCEQLTQHGGVDASQIQVSVKDGEVTLSGSVNSRLEKRLAEDAIENCTGVKQVHNQLRVQTQDQSQTQNQQQNQLTQQGTQMSSQGQTEMQKRSASR